MIRARLMPVNSDTMEPTFRQGRDVLAVSPADHFSGEGIYLLLHGDIAQPFRVTWNAGQGVVLSRDNSRYGEPLHLSWAEFEEAVLGKVVGRFEAYTADAYAAYRGWLASRQAADLPKGGAL